MKRLSKRHTVSLILKGIVVLTAVIGVYLSAAADQVGARAFMFFTIQSNILIALICAVGAVLLLRKSAVGNGWFVIKYVGTVAITLTAGVFVFMLAPTRDDAWNLQNILTHVIVPVASIADFFVTGIDGELRMKHVPFVVLPPLAYVIFASVGYCQGWEFYKGSRYPYFFLNWGSPAGAFGFIKEFPFMGCVWWILLLAVLLMAVGAGYVLLVNRMKRRGKPDTK